MDLIKKVNETARTPVLNEDGAGGAVGGAGGAIAACAMPLFSTVVKRSAPKITVIQWGKSKKPKKPAKRKLGLKEAFSRMSEGEDGAMDINMNSGSGDNSSSSFDPSAIISKLKGLEAKGKQDARNTVSFGLEDEDGGVVRVTVSTDQAEDFEKALQAFISDAEREEDSVPEIAEVLFKLKDRFDIVDVQWPDVHEDEEEDQQVAGGNDQGQPGGDLDVSDGQVKQGGEDMAPPAPEAGGDDVKGLLTQVIDMMKADAEARKAEARAREAEAKTKEADAIVQQTMSKVKQEEQFLDMEQYNKDRKEEEREAKRLAQLAKWKRDVDREDGGEPDEDQFSTEDKIRSLGAGREEEERTRRAPAQTKPAPQKQPKTLRGRVHPHDLASFILSRVK